MSISKPWNHFGSHQPFPDKQNLFYRDTLPSSLLPAFSFSAFSNMNALSADEMERFQRLSNNYQPDVEVGGQ
jgi:ubiquitin thioesterase protein OTUB1